MCACVRFCAIALLWIADPYNRIIYIIGRGSASEVFCLQRASPPTEEAKKMTWAIGIDTGGTFTDVIAMDKYRGDPHSQGAVNAGRPVAGAAQWRGGFPAGGAGCNGQRHFIFCARRHGGHQRGHRTQGRSDRVVFSAGGPAVGTGQDRPPHAQISSWEGLLPKSTEWRSLA